MSTAFDGLRVIEIGGGEAPRYCGMLFADFGAEVVVFPDLNAEWQPHGGLDPDYFGRMLDRAKHPTVSVGKEAYLPSLLGWLEGADVLIDGSVRGGLPANGLTYEELRERFPRLTIIALSMAGREGPSSHIDGCDLIAAARTPDLWENRSPHRPPTRTISHKAELYAGVLGFSGCVARLLLPENTRGGVIEVAYSDALLSCYESSIEGYFSSGRVPGPRRRAGFDVYLSRDGFVVIILLGADEWRRLCELIDVPHLIAKREAPEAEEAVARWAGTLTSAEIVAALHEIEVISAEVLTVPQAVEDEQVQSLDLVIEARHGEQTWRTGGYPLELSRTPARPRDRGQSEPGAWSPRELNHAREASPGAPQKPLEGLIVLDFCALIAGPYCTMTLADLGATVVKIENPSRAAAAMGGSAIRDRNKLSLMTDLRSEEGQQLVRRLIKQADVLVTNLGPGAMDRLGLGEDACASMNPRLVYARITGLGNRGPRHNHRVTNSEGLANSGFLSLNGFPEDPPVRPAQAHADYLTGMGMTAGVLTALYERQASGRGQVVHTSLLQMSMATLGGVLERYLETGIEPRRMGNDSQFFGERCAIWPTLDARHIAIDVTASAALAAFMSLRGIEEPDLLTQELRTYAASLPGYDAQLQLNGLGIPAAVTSDIRDTASVPDYWVRGVLRTWTDTRGTRVIPSSPVRLDGQPLAVRNLAPAPGSNQADVIALLGQLESRRFADAEGG